VIDWLDSHQGSVVALLTLVYVSATIALALIAVRSNRMSQRQLELVVELERRRSRPYLTFDLEPRKGLMYVTLRNSGLTGAYDVTIDVTPRVEQHLGGRVRECALTKHTLSAVPPGRLIELLLDSSPSFFDHHKDRQFGGRVVYKDEAGLQYQEPIRIDLSFWEDFTYTPDPDIAKEVKKLTEVVQAIGRNRA
jgi:hypothetical protein